MDISPSCSESEVVRLRSLQRGDRGRPPPRQPGSTHRGLAAGHSGASGRPCHLRRVPVGSFGAGERPCRDDPMSEVRSKDGTPIAFDRSGAGPPSDRRARRPERPVVRRALRRGVGAELHRLRLRPSGLGDSGDTPPYAVDREVEDIDALISEAGGSAWCTAIPRVRSSPSRRRLAASGSRSSRSRSRRSSSTTADLPPGRYVASSRRWRPRAGEVTWSRSS